MTTNQFNLLINEHTSALKAFALKFTNDLDDAQDLLQDTMMKAVRFYHKFDEGTNLKGWLFVIMKNTFINSYRRSIKSKTVITVEEEISSARLMHSSTNNGSESNFAISDIKAALAKLPAHLSTPFIRYFEGYKYNEIAKELNIPLGTVKTHIHEARKHLCKMLKMYNDRIN